jgi:RHS repeat-associated protein
MAIRNYAQSYTYDEVGNIMEMKHLAAGGNWTRGYEYENTSNRLMRTSIGDNGNPANYVNYQHHAQHGYMEELPHLEKLEWNFKEEVVLTSRQRCTNDKVPVITYYQYDSTGQRVRKITENQAAAGAVPTIKDERVYISGYERYTKDLGVDGVLERVSLSLLDEGHRFVTIETRNDVNDGTEKKLVRYQLHNHQGSAGLELDGTSDAKVISYEEYHPFGTTAYQATNADIKSAAKRYRYTGMERDEETGLEYHSARYYLPWLGRWLSSDPIGIGDGVNLYSYAQNNPISYSDVSGQQATPNQTRFVEIFNEENAEDPSSAHVDTLIRAFTDSGITDRSSSVMERTQSILVLTGGNMPSSASYIALPSPHFEPITIRDLGNGRGDGFTGDTGFRPELRDSLAGSQHVSSSNQIGHFLTAVDIGIQSEVRKSMADDLDAADRQFREEHPIFWALAQGGGGSQGSTLSPSDHLRIERSVMIRAMIGHELVADGTGSGSNGSVGAIVASVWRPSSTDITNFMDGNLDQITLNTSQRGNTYEDLLLTYIGYRFGVKVQHGDFTSNDEAARWLTMMLTDTDLSQVPESDPFYQDAQDINAALIRVRPLMTRSSP